MYFEYCPGETLIVEAGRIVERFRQAALPEGGPEAISEEAALAAIDSALTNSVEVHQRSDVPYGMFLSGGIDSSAVLALMARLNENPVLAYTIGFSDTRAQDERDHARDVAAAVGARHIEVDFTEDDFWTIAPKVAEIMDDPVADYAELPTYKLAQIAAQDVKVVLVVKAGMKFSVAMDGTARSCVLAIHASCYAVARSVDGTWGFKGGKSRLASGNGARGGGR